ncbi:fatty acyl-AMP ligase [Jatrophihabitans lederbergiae]|uniref:Fatty acyl-AMP ligase n=1 Tax=Jatrophihabitans lederbergiae TaxID=3075547 RepID=A0ABU2JCB1_9ACTN|nr:fatty acyl-AMP ligase [Jatrophihabitans sp. DSM 44399]MDT0262314.1 fatty acyl-AMP ligase [Jatrophihabitans sp. DSM 44399]
MTELRERSADPVHWPTPVDVPGSDLLSVLTSHARSRTDEAALIQLGADGTESARLNYRELYEGAARVAGQLAEHTIPGDRALLVYGSSVEFATTLFGCFYAGIVAVPVPLPDGSVGGVRTSRLNRIASDCLPRLVLADQAPADLDIAALPVFDTRAVEAEFDGSDGPAAVPPSRLAMLQYTSGSTGFPRGVRITHANFIDNLRAATEAQELGEREPDEIVFVSWLPHFHDMGLAQILAPLLVGGTAVCMAATGFLRSPVAWLDAISRYRGHSAASPNFGYDRCIEQVNPAQKAGLDLSSWRIALNGSEPVRPQTLSRFARAFADCGFVAESFRPSYGMAEATVYVSGFRRSDDARTLTVSGSAIDARGEVVLNPAVRDAREYVGCGRWPANLELRIVDPATGASCAADRVGEIWLRGPGVSAGYWTSSPKSPTTTEAADDAVSAKGESTAELRTGDFGFVHQGQLFIIGRRDSVMIVNGRNHYAEDVERTAEQAHPALLRGGAAAFLADSGAARKAITIVCEVRRDAKAARELGTDRMAGSESSAATPVHQRRQELAEQITMAIRTAVSVDHYLAVADVVLLRAGTLPRTSSGKVQRDRCRSLLAEGGLRPWH